MVFVFFFQAEDGIRDADVTGVQTCALPIFVVGWLFGLAVVGAIVLLVAPDAADHAGRPKTWVSGLQLVLGALLVLIALKNWRGRPHEGDEAATPRWMGAIDRFTAP